MRISTSTLKWIALAAIVLPIAGMRIANAMKGPEERIRDRIEHVLTALEDRKARRVVRALTEGFHDETGGYGRDDVRDAVRYMSLPGTRYRATLREPDGLTFIELNEGEPMTAKVRVKCLIEWRPSGANAPGFTDADFTPWWDLEFEADMVREGSRWKISRTRDVNHRDRPRR